MVEKALLTTWYLLERRIISRELKLIDEDCDDVSVPTLFVCQESFPIEMDCDVQMEGTYAIDKSGNPPHGRANAASFAP
jgi:hypothetical protein